MEAFKSYFLITEIEGKKYLFTHKSFAPTGFEAAEKSKAWLMSVKRIKEIRLLKWRVLNPFQAHFK